MKLASKLLVLLFFALEARAGLFRVESETLTSARNGSDSTFELPAYEFMSANYVSNSRDLAMNMNLSVYADPIRARDEFIVHLLNVHYEALPSLLSFDLGRNFDVEHTIRSTTIDTISSDLLLWEKSVRVGVIYGKERRLEARQWRPSAVVVGGRVSYTSPELFPVYVRAKFQHRDFERGPDTQENLVQSSLSKSFAGAWSPEVLLDSELNTGRGQLNRMSAGWNLFPNYKTALRIRGETYMVREMDGVEQPIFSIFSQGRLYEAGVQVDHQFRPDLNVSLALAYDNYVVQAPLRTDGAKLELDLRYRYKNGGVGNSVYLLRSYGGEVYGDRVTFTQHLSDAVDLLEGLDFAYYRKVTSSSRPAINSELELSFSATNRLRCTLGGEINSNNHLRYDARAFVRLIYYLWTET